MSDDICDKLVRFSQHKQCMSTDLEVEAAAEITRLREENARLWAALKPFATAANSNIDSNLNLLHAICSLTIDDFRAAAAAFHRRES